MAGNKAIRRFCFDAIRVPGASFGEIAMGWKIIWFAAGILFLLAHVAAISKIDAMRQAKDPFSEPICFSSD